MKHKLVFLLTAFFCLTTLVSPVMADNHAITNWSQLNPAKNFVYGSGNILNLPSALLGGLGSSTPGLLTLAIVFGGILLLVMLFVGGFDLLTNPTNPQAQERGQRTITYAIVGFLLLFLSYWIIQILEIVFGISVV